MNLDLDDDFDRARRTIAAAMAATPIGEKLTGTGYSDATPGAKLAVLEAIPLSELTITAEQWSWEKSLPQW